jgi:uncharacterized protein YybS (DUF2232 family)
MEKVLFIISFLCIAAIPCLLAAGILKKTKHEPSGLWFQGMGMMFLFAVLSFVLGFMLQGYRT